mmetsp:Transcript_123108/g.184122  ORF Transcript_123108/g.184122 Transcript_123108/m.184122 type:complete len:127 (-) Transcript_123108:249-629(-)
MQTSTFVLLVVAVLAVLPSAFTFMLAPTPPALRSATSKFSCATPSARARNLAVTLSMKDDEEDDGLDECMLVMKPCDPAITTDEDQCLDEEALEACVEKSEAELQMKMAKLADTDKKEEMLQDGSF